ncbi:MAG: formate dehydrogenase subunit gamma [Mesorhizobium sp.]
MTMQPAGTEIQPDDLSARTLAVIAEHDALEGPLLPILHGIQDEFGYVPRGSLPIIAEALNISNAEAHGVATFYHDYRAAPAGRHVLKLCQAEACQSMGSDNVAAMVKKALGIGFHETAKDGSVTLEPVYCLGLCACAPSALLDGEPIGRVDAEAVEEIVAQVRR